ncbi:MAG: HDOD domain-containing protein [Gallionella sp.]|jgi:HD-like signal output (HDOD) protein
MDKCEIFRLIASQVAQAELAFPTGVQVALKVRDALDDEDCQLTGAARLIQAEPLLASRVIAIANSVVYNRSGQAVTEVKAALSMLGFSTVRSLAMALVTRQMAGQSSDPQHRELLAKLWEHTAHVAALAHAIARHVTHQNPESALFAAIVHDIGGFYMLSRAAEFPQLLMGDFSEWIESGEVLVGRAVLARLAVPDAVSAVLEEFWEGYLAMPPVTLADTLLLAEDLSPVASPLHHIAGVDEGRAAALEILIGEEMLSRILTEAAEEVASLTRALQC